MNTGAARLLSKVGLSQPPEEEEPPHRSFGTDVTTALKLLKNERRRLTITEVHKADGPVPLGELAITIAAVECMKPQGEIRSTERKRVYIVLYQAHLPKLSDHGVIQWDKRSKIVSPGPNLEAYQEAIETLQEFAGAGRV